MPPGELTSELTDWRPLRLRMTAAMHCPPPVLLVIHSPYLLHIILLPLSHLHINFYLHHNCTIPLLHIKNAPMSLLQLHVAQDQSARITQMHMLARDQDLKVALCENLIFSERAI